MRDVAILSWSPQSAALLVMQRHPVAEGVQRAPFAPYGAYFAGGAGFVVTFASLVFALIPSESKVPLRSAFLKTREIRVIYSYNKWHIKQKGRPQP